MYYDVFKNLITRALVLIERKSLYVLCYAVKHDRELLIALKNRSSAAYRDT